MSGEEARDHRGAPWPGWPTRKSEWRWKRGSRAVADQRAVDPDPVGERVDAERIGAPQHDVGHLAGLQGADPVVDAERARRVGGDPADRLAVGDRQAGAAAGGRARSAASWLSRWPSDRVVGMDDRAAAGGVDHRRILLDRVERLHLEAPPARPGGDADALAREQRRDLVGLDGVVEGADPEAELARDVDHDRHLVGAVAMVLDQDLAAQHAGQGVELEVAPRRIAGAARSCALVPARA